MTSWWSKPTLPYKTEVYMLAKFRDPNIPAEVRKASGLIITYALIVFISAIWYGVTSNFEDTRGFIRAMIRFGGMFYVAWWLLSLDKKAWWFAIIPCTLFLIMGIVAVGAFLFLGYMYDAEFLWVILRMGFVVLLLGQTVYLLSKKTTRNYFN